MSSLSDCVEQLTTLIEFVSTKKRHSFQNNKFDAAGTDSKNEHNNNTDYNYYNNNNHRSGNNTSDGGGTMGVHQHQRQQPLVQSLLPFKRSKTVNESKPDDNADAAEDVINSDSTTTTTTAVKTSSSIQSIGTTTTERVSGVRREREEVPPNKSPFFFLKNPGSSCYQTVTLLYALLFPECHTTNNPSREQKLFQQAVSFLEETIIGKETTSWTNTNHVCHELIKPALEIQSEDAPAQVQWTVDGYHGSCEQVRQRLLVVFDFLRHPNFSSLVRNTHRDNSSFKAVVSDRSCIILCDHDNDLDQICIHSLIEQQFTGASGAFVLRPAKHLRFEFNRDRHEKEKFVLPVSFKLTRTVTRETEGNQETWITVYEYELVASTEAVWGGTQTNHFTIFAKYDEFAKRVPTCEQQKAPSEAQTWIKFDDMENARRIGNVEDTRPTTATLVTLADVQNSRWNYVDYKCTILEQQPQQHSPTAAVDDKFLENVKKDQIKWKVEFNCDERCGTKRSEKKPVEVGATERKDTVEVD